MAGDGHSRKRIELDTKKVLIEYNSGKRIGAIAKQFGVSSSPIIRVLTEELGHSPTRHVAEVVKTSSRKRVTVAKVKSNGELATLHLSARALDSIWNDLALDIKARLIEQLEGLTS